MTDYWQNEQFGEDDDEIMERQRLTRIKSRCPICGKNPKLGYPHAPDCAALKSVRDMSDWQPIETAPKDGVRIIVALFGWALPRHSEREFPLADIWDDSIPREYQCFYACTGFWSDKYQNWNDGMDELREPSHWMPIPAAPVNIHAQNVERLATEIGHD